MPRGRNLTPQTRALATIAAKADIPYAAFRTLTNLAMPGRNIPEGSQEMLQSHYIQHCTINTTTWKALYRHVLSMQPRCDIPKKAFALVAHYAQTPNSEWQQFYPGEHIPTPQNVPATVQQIHQNDWQILWNHSLKPKSNFGKG